MPRQRLHYTSREHAIRHPRRRVDRVARQRAHALILRALLAVCDERLKAALARPKKALGLRNGIDLTTAAGRALAGMLSVFSAFERDLLIERVRSGMAHARKHGTRSGRAIGRPATVAARATEIRALAHQGVSMAGIARQLHLGYGSVHRTLCGVPARHK